MKILFLLLFYVISIASSYSQNEKLYYYIENDSLLGVKNEIGKIIIPARRVFSPNIFEELLKDEIKENVIFFWEKNEGAKAYNRKGEFLFIPYFFDGAFDEFSEGFMRFEKDKKIGLANQYGEIIIPAKYDFLSPINFGYASFCNGCYFDRKQDSEHPPLVDGVWGYVDKFGNEIIPNPKKQNPKDLETKEHTYLPYLFKYSEKEKKILDFLDNRKDEIFKIIFENCIGCESYKIDFEIIEKPNKINKYYKIKLYEIVDINNQINFFGAIDSEKYKNFEVSEDGKEFYVIYTEIVDYKDYSKYEQQKMKVDDWIKNNLKK